jgi:hypothetical protein
MSTGSRVKREDSNNAIIPDPAPGSSSLQQQRATENNNNNNNNNNNAPGSSTGSSNDDGGSINNFNTILKRLDHLEDENNMLKKKLERLEGCSPTKLVEFKFTSLNTKLLNENEWNGIFHIPLIQDPVSGFYKIPNEITTVKGRYTHKKKKGDNDGGSEVMITEDFIGRTPSNFNSSNRR